jgi:hypothetical protein
MKIYGITIGQLEEAVRFFNCEVGTSIYVSEVRTGVDAGILKPARPWVKCVLRLKWKTARYHKMTRTSPFVRRDPRPTRYLCWHGFRDVFRLWYDWYPHAEIHSGPARYRNVTHFEAIHETTVRYQMCPADQCECEAQYFTPHYLRAATARPEPAREPARQLTMRDAQEAYRLECIEGSCNSWVCSPDPCEHCGERTRHADNCYGALEAINQ